MIVIKLELGSANLISAKCNLGKGRGQQNVRKGLADVLKAVPITTVEKAAVVTL